MGWQCAWKSILRYLRFSPLVPVVRVPQNGPGQSTARHGLRAPARASECVARWAACLPSPAGPLARCHDSRGSARRTAPPLTRHRALRRAAAASTGSCRCRCGASTGGRVWTSAVEPIQHAPAARPWLCQSRGGWSRGRSHAVRPGSRRCQYGRPCVVEIRWSLGGCGSFCHAPLPGRRTPTCTPPLAPPHRGVCAACLFRCRH